jgi:two-component system nitrate/nitrite response regulator NarL
MPIKIAIAEDHQSIIDGYLYRLNQDPEMEIVGCVRSGSDLEPMLADQQVDVLLLDIHLPISASDRTPFPMLQTLPRLIKRFSDVRILVISMSTQAALIKTLVQTGVSGYIFKDDQESIQKLPAVVSIVAQGGMYFSPGIQPLMRNASLDVPTLTQRQIEILSLCAKYPDITTAEIASHLHIAHSTVRNALAQAYQRLGVRTRTAALARLQQMGVF